jgi:prepilin-type N-terminal cleavage/methylation domain-containing protein
MRESGMSKLRGFSLIELVIVVVIVAIIGAIAIPRMSRGAAGAGDASLLQNLSALRGALDMYQSENGGIYPSAANITNALLQYSDGNGGIASTPDATHIYGPYLRSIPPLPVGAAKGCNGIAGAVTNSPVTGGVGWNYNSASGQIIANTTAGEVDARGVPYNQY